MVVDLGPCPAEDVLRWSRMARRIVAELRSQPDEDPSVSPDVLDLWSRTLDDWTDTADRLPSTDAPFRWSAEFEPEVAEFLLHGLD